MNGSAIGSFICPLLTVAEICTAFWLGIQRYLLHDQLIHSKIAFSSDETICRIRDSTSAFERPAAGSL